MNLNHNKKRNIGMLREFFSKHIASCMIHRDKKSIVEAQNLWLKYIKPGSEIEKELRLSTLMLETKFNNKEIAHSFLIKIKKACENISESKLEKEKTYFIREINNNIKDEKFFNRNISNYVDFATIQLLLNNWVKKSDSLNVENLHLEDKVLNFLCNKESVENNVNILECIQTNDQVDKLIVNIMNDKFNKKFNDQLTEDQKYMLREFVFNNDYNSLKNKMQILNKETLDLINKELKENVLSNFDKQKLTEIKTLLENDFYNIEDINDSNFVFYMSVSKLNEELKEDK